MTPPAWLTAKRPLLMAIGDSLLNGMRSYTMNDALAAASVPALVGGALKAATGFTAFRPAAYPRPVLIDVEAQLHSIVTSLLFPLSQLIARLDDIKADVAVNARDWLDDFARGPRPGPATFDNIAIAGAVIEDVFDTPYEDLERLVSAMEPVIRAGEDPLRWAGDDPTRPGGRWNLGDVHLAVNARHLMNPANQVGLGRMTVLDIVKARRPRILLVNLGPNHGLVDVVMRHRGDDGMKGLEAFAESWPRCARRLAELSDLEALVVMLMPRPSQVPCLMPERGTLDNQEVPPPVPGGYHPRYVSALQPVSSGEAYERQEVESFDRRMDVINARVRKATVDAFAKRPGVQVSFVDLSELLDAHDFKHRRGPKLSGGASGRAYSNYTMAQMGIRRLRGGICGYDAIHPTGITYRYVAEAVRTRLPSAWAPHAIPVTDEGDTFITKPHWPTINLLNRLYPVAGGAGAGAAPMPGEKETERLLFRPPWLGRARGR